MITVFSLEGLFYYNLNPVHVVSHFHQINLSQFLRGHSPFQLNYHQSVFMSSSQFSCPVVSLLVQQSINISTYLCVCSDQSIYIYSRLSTPPCRSLLIFNSVYMSTSLCLYSQVSTCPLVIRQINQSNYVFVSLSTCPPIIRQIHQSIYVFASLSSCPPISQHVQATVFCSNAFISLFRCFHVCL